ncbi:phosphatase 2C-like domain-containing protein [Jimgerdemannia flammicorona]|uniref:Phosphatase 2C-like domain-containing protein n=2 Tax=Jimgerdemannia flammicorona TaxID=994334 RepID=A0A433AUE7_9FUNG|nr:phosphatase 2C-like domain-containing protein [Jimgerdemannia flammicorona]RUS25078.1 hypothetical protein BC938DRAFT_472656 [Jimgerdemannia flammicorona]
MHMADSALTPASQLQQSATASPEARKAAAAAAAHPASGFRIGFSEDCNKKRRRTMEDAHSYFYDFGGVCGQGFFAIFDGHASKSAAEWCGNHLHETLLKCLEQHPNKPIPEVLNLTYVEADRKLNDKEGKSSGCTTVSCFLRIEKEEGAGDAGVTNGQAAAVKQKRVLYTANVGDARAVLCRNGQAVRLTYDHKGSDAQEAKRIMDLGGFVMNNRVNGVLAVTRSLGDSTMKEFVVGNPYTTETVLVDSDPFLILACDGLWDVCDDQDAVDLIKDMEDPQLASEKLLEHALANYSTDNLSIMVVRFHHR